MLNSGWLADPESEGSVPRGPKDAPRMPNTPARGLGIVAACGCGHAVGRSAGERLSGTVGHRQAVVFGVKALFRLPAHKHHAPQPKTPALPIPAAVVMIHMEDFIERTLRERRSLQHALADLVVKYDRIPSGSERSMLERMIEVLKDEIALRHDRPHVAH